MPTQATKQLDEHLAIIKRGAVEILLEDELRARLRSGSRRARARLRRRSEDAAHGDRVPPRVRRALCILAGFQAMDRPDTTSIPRRLSERLRIEA